MTPRSTYDVYDGVTSTYTEINDRIGKALDSKRFWSLIGSKRKCSGLPLEMMLGKLTTRGAQEIAELLAEIGELFLLTPKGNFRAVFADPKSPPEEALHFEAASIESSMPLGRPFEIEEVRNALHTLDGSK